MRTSSAVLVLRWTRRLSDGPVPSQVLDNVDDLFARDELSAAPDPGWPDCFNSGVFVFRPSLQTHARLRAHALQCGSFDGNSLPHVKYPEHVRIIDSCGLLWLPTKSQAQTPESRRPIQWFNNLFFSHSLQWDPWKSSHFTASLCLNTFLHH